MTNGIISQDYSEKDKVFLSNQTHGKTRLDGLELFLACLTAFLTPINAARLPGIYITFADLCALSCLIIIFSNRGIPKRMFGPLTEFYILGIFIFTGALMLSSIVNGDAIRGLIGIAQYLLAYLIFPIVLIRRTHKEAWYIAYAFLAAMAVVCLHGIAIMTFDLTDGTRFVSINGRLRGLVERTNEFGGLLGMTVPLVIVLIRTKWIPVFLGWSFLLTILYTTMLTGSNTGMLCFVFALLGSLLFSENLSKNVVLLAAFVLIVSLTITVFGTAILPDIFEERVLTAFQSGDLEEAGTLAGRLELIQESIHLADSYLFIGMGVDQLREISLHGAPVHNIFLLILNEGGIFALFGLLLILTVIFAQSSLIISQTRSINACAFFLVTVLVFTIVISGLPHAYARFLVIPWIVALGLTSTILRR